jgi:hypothetical protein
MKDETGPHESRTERRSGEGTVPSGFDRARAEKSEHHGAPALASTTRSRLTSGQQDGGRCVGGPDGSGIPFGTTTTPVDIV